VGTVVRNARRTGSSASGGAAARRGLRTGEDRVRQALEAAINQHRSDVLDLPVPGPKLENVTVPDALASYVVEAGRASDYDHLLLADGAVHE
jgi:hypothetical protein